MSPDHERWMKRCLELAKLAKSQGNTPVGSVVVIEDRIVGEGVESLPAGDSLTGHAEILACQDAVSRLGRRLLEDATIYTTAEPCFMCSYVIRQTNISLVVFGLETPWIGGVTSSHPILIDPALQSWKPAPKVISGVLAEEYRELRTPIQ